MLTSETITLHSNPQPNPPPNAQPTIKFCHKRRPWEPLQTSTQNQE